MQVLMTEYVSSLYVLITDVELRKMSRFACTESILLGVLEASNMVVIAGSSHNSQRIAPIIHPSFLPCRSDFFMDHEAYKDVPRKTV
jgi:hypothetical protein